MVPQDQDEQQLFPRDLIRMQKHALTRVNLPAYCLSLLLNKDETKLTAVTASMDQSICRLHTPQT